MKRNKRILFGAAAILAAIVYFGFAGFQEGKAYYKTIEELSAMGDNAYEKRLRVGGIVADGSIQRQGTQVSFTLEQEGLRLPVVYVGSAPLPDTFKEGAEALCDGTYDKSGSFQASQIQAKCASKYEAEYGSTGEKHEDYQ